MRARVAKKVLRNGRARIRGRTYIHACWKWCRLLGRYARTGAVFGAGKRDGRWDPWW